MGKHTVIQEVGNGLVNLLREHLTPDIIPNADAIGLCGPDDKGDIVLGLHLYDIRENEEIRGNERQNLDAGRQRAPSAYLTLCYMITAYSKADVKFRAGEDHKILGKVVQVFHDNPILNMDTLEPAQRAVEMNLRIRMQNMAIEEKQRLWNYPNTPYRVSLFYRVSPIEVESAKILGIRRVVAVDMEVKEQE